MGQNHHLFENWRYPQERDYCLTPRAPHPVQARPNGMHAYVPQSDLHAARLWRFGVERTSAALSHKKHGSK